MREFFKISGYIYRIDFLIKSVVIWLALILPVFFAREFLADSLGTYGYFLTKALAQFIAVLLMLPITIRRLKSIEWSPYFSILFVVFSIISLENVLAFGKFISTKDYFQLYFQPISLIGSLVLLVITIVLVFKKGTINSASPP